MALILRFLTIAFLSGQEQNLYEKGEIAIHIVSGKGFTMGFYPSTPNQETCVMAPIYPYFIAFFYLIFGVNQKALLAIQITQAFIGAFTIFPIYCLEKNFFLKKQLYIHVYFLHFILIFYIVYMLSNN